MKRRRRAGSAAVLTTAIAVVVAGCSTRAEVDSAGSAAGGSAEADEVVTDIGVDGTTIRLGVLTDLTGVFASLGVDITNAHSLYWAQKNADGGVCGTYQVELDIKDTGYVPQQAVQLYSSMKDSILAVQQTIGSPINTALAPEFEADGIVTIPSAWARNLSEIPGAVVPGSTYDVEMVNGYNYLLQEGLLQDGDTVGHIYFEGEFGANGLAGSQYMAGKHDFALVEAQVKPTDQDMTAQITQFAAAGVDVIALTVAPGQLASAASVAQAQGLDVPLLANNPAFAPGLLNGPAAAKLKEDLYVSTPIAAFDQHPQLLEDYQAMFPGGEPSLGVVFGYGMSDILAQVLERACENGDLTRAGVSQAVADLGEIDTGGLLVPLTTFEPGRSPSLQSYILRPDDVPGGARVVQEAFEGADAAGVS